MHADLVNLWMENQALLIAPIAPHFAEHYWRTILGHETSVHNELFPKPTKPEDAALTAAAAYVRGTIKTIRDAEIAVTRRKTKGPAPVKFDERKPKEVSIFVADAFPAWQDVCVYTREPAEPGVRHALHQSRAGLPAGQHPKAVRL